MFRNLIPHLAGRFHVIAPDHLGFLLESALDEVTPLIVDFLGRNH